VILNWQVQKNIIVIPKSEIAARLKENISIFDFKIEKEDIEALEKLDRGLRTVDPLQSSWSAKLNIYA